MFKLVCMAMGLPVYTKDFATVDEAVESTADIRLYPDCCFTVSDETGKVVELIATQQMLNAIDKVKKQMEDGTFDLKQLSEDLKQDFKSGSQDFPEFFGPKSKPSKKEIPLDPYDDFSLGSPKKIPNKKDMN
jgi:hypothetical protein